MNIKRTCALLALTTMLGAACTTTEEDRDADLDDALGGSLDDATIKALHTLDSGLTVAHWSYLMGAQWPDDVSRALADPMLRDACEVLVGSGAGAGTRSFGAGLHTSSSPASPGLSTYSPQVLTFVYGAALAATKARNGSPTLRTPGAFAAFAQNLARAIAKGGGTPLPQPSTAADEHASQCVLEFFGGEQQTETCETVPLCCRGVIDYRTGTSLCYDATSCEGKGMPMLPSKAGTTSSGTTSGGALECGRYQILDKGGATAPGQNVLYSGTGLVLDTKTGLTWLRYRYRPYDVKLTQAAAASYCSGKGMRLPTTDEAAGRGDCAAAFGDSVWTWTSTSAGAGQAYYYVVSKELPFAADQDPGGYVGVQCVR